MREHTLAAALIMFGLVCSTVIRAEDQPIEEQIIDAMNKAFGTHPEYRANHAKGVVVEGSFKASPEAAGLSRAVLFNGKYDSGDSAILGFYRGTELAGRV